MILNLKTSAHTIDNTIYVLPITININFTVLSFNNIISYSILILIMLAIITILILNIIFHIITSICIATLDGNVAGPCFCDFD